jgi:hypothetical protein
VRDKLNGINVGGQIIQSYLYDNVFYNQSIYADRGVIDSNQLINISMNNSKNTCIYGIKIKDFIDSIDQLSDIDERNEVINDINNLVKECNCKQIILFTLFL